MSVIIDLDHTISTPFPINKFHSRFVDNLFHEIKTYGGGYEVGYHPTSDHFHIIPPYNEKTYFRVQEILKYFDIAYCKTSIGFTILINDEEKQELLYNLYTRMIKYGLCSRRYTTVRNIIY